MNYWSLFPTPIGHCGIAWRGDVVVTTSLPDETFEGTARRLMVRTAGREGEPPSAVRHAIELITALLSGEQSDLRSINCDLGNADPFSADVYNVTRTIRPGSTSTYGTVALRLGDKSLARQVGQALGRNPLPIIVPCHRVVGASGRLVGFSANGGVQTKLKMLEIERALIGATGGLFGDLPLAINPANDKQRLTSPGRKLLDEARGRPV